MVSHFSKYKLKNGLQVILTPQQETKAVTVLVLVAVGSRYEAENIAGMAHFLEHMMFKGTVRRPTTLSLSKELDQVGADFNAYTQFDHTGYWIKINSAHIDLAFDMLADMLLSSKLEAKEINRERGTILEEINMYEDDPKLYSEELLYEILFKGNELSREIIGYKSTVRKINRLQMVSFKNKYYCAPNMVLSVAGNFDKQQVKQKIDSFFKHFKTSARFENFSKFKSLQKKPQIILKYKETEQVHLSFGFIGPSLKDKDLNAAKLLAIILGGGMSSRLFINVRERHGLCYYIRARHDSYIDTGALTIQAGLDKNRIQAAIEIILKELSKIKNNGVTEAELKKAKEFIKGKLILDLEDSSSIAEWYGRQQILLKKSLTPEQKINDINKVSKKDIDYLAKYIFQNKKINLALIGPFKQEKEFIKLLKI